MELASENSIFINVLVNGVFDMYGVGCIAFGYHEFAALIRKRCGIGSIFCDGGREEFSPYGPAIGRIAQGVAVISVIAEAKRTIFRQFQVEDVFFFGSIDAVFRIFKMVNGAIVVRAF